MTQPKTYIKATSVEHALSLAGESSGSFRYLAGGTDVMVNKFQGNDDAGLLIDISGIDALRQVSATETHLVIGALVCLEELAKHSAVAGNFPVLAEAANSVASPTIRKTATLGGNLLCGNRCSFYNQSAWWREAAGFCLKCSGPLCLASGGKKHCFSKFVSDMAVALISLRAGIEISDLRGVIKIPLESIYSGDGINPSLLSNTAIIRAIHIPLHHDFRSVYKKLRKRETLDFTSLTTAVSLDKTGMIRIVMGGVHARPVITDGTGTEDLNSLVSQAVSATRMVDNDTYSRAYRKAMIPVFLERSFRELQLI